MIFIPKDWILEKGQILLRYQDDSIQKALGLSECFLLSVRIFLKKMV